MASPATSNRFFTAKGTPASGPSFCFVAAAASIALARARARSAVTAVKALSSGLRVVMRASASSITAAALTLPDATAAAISLAVDHDVSRATGSGREDGRGLGIVRQFKFGDQRRVLERHVEIGLHRRLPFGFHRQPQRARGRGDEIVKRIGIGRCSHSLLLRMIYRSHFSGSCATMADAGSPSADHAYIAPAAPPEPARSAPARRSCPSA